MAKVGRPKKSTADKVQYQLIAVHKTDYNTFIKKASIKKLKKVNAFKDMVKQYN